MPLTDVMNYVFCIYLPIT